MRKIVPKHIEEKNQRRNLRILGIILIFVLFGSVFGVAIYNFSGSKEDNQEVNEDGLVYQDGVWYYQFEQNVFAFSYPLDQISAEVPNLLKDINYYKNNPLYVFSEDKNAELEITRNLVQIVERIQPACLKDEECIGDYPIKDCSNNFIIIKESEKEEILQVKNCVYIKGNSENLVNLADEFLFRIIKIK